MCPINSVKLRDIVDALEMHGAETSSFVNKATGEVVSFGHDVLSAVEENGPEELLAEWPGWQQQEYKAARELLDHEEDFVALPDEFDIDEYSMMERFCGSVNDEGVSNALYETIRGKGAFRRFKDAIHRFGIQEQWYAYRDAEVIGIAKEWCQENGIEFRED